MWHLLWLAALCCGLGNGFNIDLPSRLIHRSDQSNSMFGFSVAMHKDNGESRLLVGAPRYNTEQRRFGVLNGGAVLRCSTEVKNECSYVPFDRKGNNVHPLGSQIDEKSRQWFGATLKSSGENGVVVACAPRYLWYTENMRRREPVGTCYVARNGLRDFQEYSPCRTRAWGYHRQGSCQAGFDAAVSKDGDRLYIGAPGAYYWQGQIHSQHLPERTEYYRTGEGAPIYDDQYLGYSVAAGEFSGDGIADVALGVPKGLNYTGKIAIYTHDLINLQNITGYQLGSYFGYCLAVTDFNNDGRDDLIVGAPLYTDYLDKEMKYEVGRVHILLQNAIHRFKQVFTFNGEVSKARFGLSVAAIGDINMDGFNDVAVGAPYGGPDGSGAVYIYHGFYLRSGEQMDAEKSKPVQVIYSTDVSPRIKTFGWSLSGGLDMDNNLYPDLLVGAYLSNSVVMLKTRPVVNLVNHTLHFKTASRSISMEDNTCSKGEGACVDLELCMSYSGVGVGPQADFNVKYGLDSKVNEPRILFVENNNRVILETLRLRKDSTLCKVKEVYLRSAFKDKLSPLTAEVSYGLAHPSLSRRRRGAPLYPVLNQKQKMSIQDAISIRKNCGPDNVCVPDLTVTVEAPATYILGKPEQLSIRVRVTNDAEDAFEASVFIPVPQGLLYNKFIALEDTFVTCSPRRKDGTMVVVCDIGNPLVMHKGVLFDIFFQQSGNLAHPYFEFLVTANSTNAEADHDQPDNIQSAIVDVVVDTELLLYGVSDPEMLDSNITLYPVKSYEHEEDFGPEIIHRYDIVNRGPSDVYQVNVAILWPAKSSSGNDLLYVLEQPFTSGSVTCTKLADVNPLNLQLYNRADTYKRLKLKAQGGSSSVSHYQSSSSLEQSSVQTEGESSGYSGSSRGSSFESEYSSSHSGEGAAYGSGHGSSGSSGSSSSSYYSSSSSSSGGNYSSSQSYSSSSGYKSESAEANKIRSRRAADSPELDWDVEIENCGDVDCMRISCVAGPLTEGDSVSIFVRSRAQLHTLQEESTYPYKDIIISSNMVTKVSSLPQGVNPDFLKVQKVKVSTSVSPSVSLDTPPPVPWWIILLAILVGIAILLLIILVLWRLGFFKRRRPQSYPQ